MRGSRLELGTSERTGTRRQMVGSVVSKSGLLSYLVARFEHRDPGAVPALVDEDPSVTSVCLRATADKACDQRSWKRFEIGRIVYAGPAIADRMGGYQPVFIEE